MKYFKWKKVSKTQTKIGAQQAKQGEGHSEYTAQQLTHNTAAPSGRAQCQYKDHLRQGTFPLPA